MKESDFWIIFYDQIDGHVDDWFDGTREEAIEFAKKTIKDRDYLSAEVLKYEIVKKINKRER